MLRSSWFMESRNVPHMDRLVIVAPNWLGDAVMALPAVADIRRAWPAAHVAVAARPPIAPLFSLVDGVDEVITLPGHGVRAAAETLRARSFGAAVLLPNSFHAALVAWRAAIPERWGYRADWRRPLLTRAFSPPRHVHQAAYYQALVGQLGCESGPLRPALHAPDAIRRGGIDILAAAGWDRQRPLVAIAPGAAYGGAKQWPTASFAALATELSRGHGAIVVLIGAGGDVQAGAEVEARVEGSIINLIGRTDLPLLAGVLLACRGLVTNDSGAMHFAAALGVSVTAMFGPTRESETRPIAGPDGDEPVVLTHHVWCRPCMLRECPLTHACMRGITVENVLAAARRTL